ncbi:MAG TPA: 16S rRNA (cytosine(967)-C(5))-methyltransferase RsmB [Burkholderiaceae bacterium]|nr:16S rRNA (cytosine(967)-C(5))-methyltransferase RsmB [Burkholderiaceae bacterium]
MNPPSLPLARLLAHAADAVQAVRAGRSLNDALLACPTPARPGTQALAFDAMRHLGVAESLRKRLVPRAPAPWTDALLLTVLALLERVGGAPYPDHTLVDQAVEAAKRRDRRAAAFVNAVLRRFLREREALRTQVQALPLARWNHPPWWIERLQADWPQQWQEVLAFDNTRPPLVLRVNLRRTTQARALERLQAAGITAHPAGPWGVVVEPPRPVQELPGFAEGELSVQDRAAQLAAPLLLGMAAPGDAPQLPPGARVLDACAAPGGKTAHLLELADLEVTALDVDPERLARVQDTLDRLGLAATLKAGDARETSLYWDGRPYDAILLDAPCSASGIVRRHPDVRWLRRPGDLDALARLQGEMLDALWPLLAPGGRLLYCTCSVFRAEGAHQIDAFLQRQSRAHRLPAPGHLLPMPHNQAQSDGAPAAGPLEAGADGFFYALLEKHNG